MPCSTPRSKYAKRLAELPPCGPVEAVYFYGAGCGGTFPEATEKMVRELRTHFGAGHIEAQTDLLGAARALFGRGEGVACILGTGSNSCWCRGGEIVENVPPLGYVLGDEGSGAAMGRNLVNGIFKGHIPLREEFLAAHGLTYERSSAGSTASRMPTVSWRRSRRSYMRTWIVPRCGLWWRKPSPISPNAT